MLISDTFGKQSLIQSKLQKGAATNYAAKKNLNLNLPTFTFTLVMGISLCNLSFCYKFGTVCFSMPSLNLSGKKEKLGLRSGVEHVL